MVAIGEDPDSTGTNQHAKLMKTIATLTLDLRRHPTIDEIKEQVQWRLSETAHLANRQRMRQANPGPLILADVSRVPEWARPPPHPR